MFGGDREVDADPTGFTFGIGDGFGEIVDRTAGEREAAGDKRARVEQEGETEQAVVDPIVPTKSLSPEKRRVHDTDPVDEYGDQKVAFVG